MKNYKNELDKILSDTEKPSRYIGGELFSVYKDCAELRFAFCFPDIYDIGMSHLGMKILYSLINDVSEYACERVFAPMPDMEHLMRENGILLYGLESLSPIRDFDIIGFTLQYELSYTSMLNMLDLAGVPVLKSERSELLPVVIAGGPCACNGEPLCDFIDLFVIGEGEEVTLELMELLRRCKTDGTDKREFLKLAAKISGVYVPELYDVSYNGDGTVNSVTATSPAPAKIQKRIIRDFDKVFYPKNFIVPFSEIVHDRAIVEVLRGCIRGCRFCQAGFIYRPFREKSSNTILSETRDLCESTGYDEVSLSSLSTSDYSEIESLLRNLTSYTSERRTNLSLPSLRIDKFSKEILDEVRSVRKSGLTFAPEAGTQRLRDVINKNISEKNILDSCRIAFESGYTNVKLYFMLGLPTETSEDIAGIADIAQSIAYLYYSRRPKKPLSINISLSTFVPKPFTPFQYEPQAAKSDIDERQKFLLNKITNKKVRVSWSDYRVSVLEAALARGDRRLGKVIYEAWKNGCNLDGWGEYFKFDVWERAFETCGLNMDFYARRKRGYDEIMPWGHIDVLVSEKFLRDENKKAYEGAVTENCMQKCSSCGVSLRLGGCCIGKR